MATTFVANDLQTIAYGGETNDTQTETLDSIVGTVNVAPSATFAQTGTYSMAFDMTTNGNKAFLRGTGDTGWGSPPPSGILVVSFAAGLSGAPTAEVSVFASDQTTTMRQTGTTPQIDKYIRIGTDRKIKLYDHFNNLLYTSTALVPTAGAMREVCISYDSLNHPTVWIKVYMDGVEEAAFDSGRGFNFIFHAADFVYWGEYLATASNPGVTLYLDDFIVRYSSEPTEAPHLVPYPRIRVASPVIPDANSVNTAWDAQAPAGTGSANPDYQQVQTNDGNSNVVASAVQNAADSWKSSTTNPMPIGATVIKAQLRQVARLGGAGKTAPDMMFGTAGFEASQSSSGYIGSISTSYTSRVCPRLIFTAVSDPNFGIYPPPYSAANPNVSAWGVVNPGSGTPNATLTFGPGPEWVYYTAVLPVGTAPPTTVETVDTSNPGTATDAGVT